MLTSTFLCYFSRAVTVLVLCWLLNRYREHRISYKFQLVIFLGGLRGAVAYTMIIREGSLYSPWQQSGTGRGDNFWSFKSQKLSKRMK